ncbi:uncharacterized protein LOC132732944 [Ruditapes philippinarum]|uniref:uncharacterized protein LOC132732944 n=1 Tax=Ruditapes philippinarum TaxID=129788 RepID=UPI00295BF4FF|nr:uncharacterized protein LOC132732944 [Ruditapes philippinarum]XP_060575564.1 uncharacterized protein LOC132732944 [Ruditapes philippinarum]XP_060575640.1 uncharacterized protein LOC132732944 [Ruditapes philippinarum]
MEYCTEIAILQSAFQLVSKKAGKTLSLLPKENCKDLVTIIWTSVEEICKGIQYDLDVKERLLWQQKLHSVLLYVLVKNKYREKEEPVREGRVPVLGAIDMFTGILPTYSCSFYFELMKCCDWTENFLQSLQCLDYKTSSSLLNDLLQHCHSSPVTFEDGKVIAMVKDTLLSRCLCVPDYPSQLCAKLFEPLTQARKYVQTVYPEDEAETFVTMGKQNAAPIDNVNNNSCAGISFWNTFVEENPQILDMVMAYYENSLDGHLKKLSSQELLEVLSQLAVYLYFTTVEPGSDFTDKWFINNLFVQDYCKNMKGDSLDIVYSLNFTLIPHVHNNLSRSQLNVCLWKALNVLSRSCKVEHLTSKEPHIVHIVSGLSVNLVVLLRMLAGLLGNGEAVVEKFGVSGSLLTGNIDLLSWIQGCATSFAGTCTTDQGLVLGEAWTDDVTMESLLWRIDHNLPQCQVCVDRLLDLTNIKFWTTDRLYTSMMKHPVLLGRVDRVLKLSQILDILKGGNNLPIASTLLDLIISSFPELSFPDQDTVVMEIYCRGDNSVKEFFQDSLTSKVTNVFNKVTADMDSQVLREIILLCLGDPLLVLSTAVSLCVRNEQQARNCALIMHHVQKTCKCRHPENHHDTSLLVILLSEFLNTQSLTEKEQKCFVIFISELMMPGGSFSNKDSNLSPSEFFTDHCVAMHLS